MILQPPSFPRLVQDFFSQRLVQQQNASAHTVSSYRDTFRLLFSYGEQQLGKQPSELHLADLDASFILAFLNHLEVERGNSIRSRNSRLAAIRSFLGYAALRDPESLGVVQHVQAIPMKRCDRPLLGFLTQDEVRAVIDAPDCSTWSGERDHAMWATFYNTGARVSEIIGLCNADIDLARKACHIRGKGRKERMVPLWKSTLATLSRWRRRSPNDPKSPVFPNRTGQPLTRSGVEERLRRAVRAACAHCPTLQGRVVSPHTFRHTTAMHLLQSGVDITVIALWLGHEKPDTTHHYIEADLAMKEQALARLSAPTMRRQKFRPSDRLLVFLEGL